MQAAGEERSHLYLCDHLTSSEVHDYDAMDYGDPEVPPV
jgi:hypothetical protein